MLNLIKHELIKSRQVILITAALFGLIELMYIISSMAGWGFIYIMTTVILSVIITSSAIIPIIYAAFLYDMDISHKHKNGYMLFMTPNSAYKIIGAKMLASIIISIALLLFIFIIMAVNTKLSSFFTVPDGEDFNIFSMMSYDNLSFSYIFISCAAMIVQIANVTAIVYLAKMLGDTVFVNIKFRSALSFISGVGLYFIQTLILYVLMIKTITKTDIAIIEEPIFSGMKSYMIIAMIISILFGIAEYYAASELCKRKLNM
ncbi:MAG: hypothetical protein ACI4JM_05705 [Oscillospiraceae bacterium]